MSHPASPTLWACKMNALDLILPIAVKWVESQRDRIIRDGLPLAPSERIIAAAIGVKRIDEVRVLLVSEVPLPTTEPLRSAAVKAGFCTLAGAAAMALDTGIYIRKQLDGDKGVLAHELVHVAQYERLGGIRPFLRAYISECLSDGYHLAPLELEADAVAQKYHG